MEVPPAVSMRGPDDAIRELEHDIPVPDDDDDEVLFGDCEDFLMHPNSNQA